MSGATTAIAIAAVAVSAVSTAYSVYSANEAADERRDALKEQKAQTIEAAGIQSEQQRKQGAAMQAQARANAAASGLSLSDTDSTVGVIQNQISADTTNNVNLIQKQAGWQAANINNEISAQPKLGQLATQGALSFASSAMSSYSNLKANEANSSLLARQNFSTSSSNWIQNGAQPTTGQSFTNNVGTSTGSYSLLG